MAKFPDDKFFNMQFDDGSTDIWCGECITRVINDTSLTEDESVNEENVLEMLDDGDPIQCGNCNKQNEAYLEWNGEDYD